MIQETIFDLLERPRPTIGPTDPNVEAVERPRLSRQCEAVLERLRRGPCTAVEFARSPDIYGCNPRARISDLRKHGFRIPAPREDPASGVSIYRLADDSEP